MPAPTRRQAAEPARVAYPLTFEKKHKHKKHLKTSSHRCSCVGFWNPATKQTTTVFDPWFCISARMVPTCSEKGPCSVNSKRLVRGDWSGEKTRVIKTQKESLERMIFHDISVLQCDSPNESHTQSIHAELLSTARPVRLVSRAFRVQNASISEFDHERSHARARSDCGSRHGRTAGNSRHGSV